MIYKIILLVCFQIYLCHCIKYGIPNEEAERESKFWYKLGETELKMALERKDITSVAKNVILFLGDGMGITVTSAARIYKGQKKGRSGEEEALLWENFPSLGQIKTYNLDRQVSDSAGTATAYLGGVKANYYTLGVNGHVKSKDCEKSLQEENRVSSILKWSQDAGKETGFVTTTRVTHASPAALYAHSAYRYWETDSKLKEDEGTAKCKDIARQLIEDDPGKNIKVIFGGGRHMMGAALEGDDESPYKRNDSRNLVQEWMDSKKEQNSSVKYVKNNREFKALDIENTEYIMGLFGGSHVPYSYLRNQSAEGSPSLKELTEAAIKRLQKSEKGYFLMVEGGRIDHALHDTKPRIAFEDLLDFEMAVEAALELTDEEETLIIVTADHSHVMTINGYPGRGNDILGTTFEDEVVDNMEYTTLMFTNGIGYNYTWNKETQKVMRANVSQMDTRDFDFIPLAAVPMEEGYETHGGEDVAAYARGPFAHLFHRVHDQSYVAHVMGYASCVGPYKENCGRKEANSMAREKETIYKAVRDPTTRRKPTNNSNQLNLHAILVLISYAIIYVTR